MINSRVYSNIKLKVFCKIFFSCVPFIILSSTLTNCAAFNRKNTPIIRAVEKNMVPESTPAKILLAPIYMTVGVAGGLVDIFIIHPALQIVPALVETKALLWSIKFNGYFSEMGSLPVRAVLSPAFFTINFLFKSSFDFNSSIEYSNTNKEKNETIEKLIEQKNANGIINWINSTDISIKDKEAIQRIFKEYPAYTENGIYPSLVGKLCEKKLYDVYEDFLISLFPKNSSGNLTYCFVRQKSKKFSNILLKTIMNPDLPPEKFHEYMVVLLNIQNPDDLKIIREKIQK